MQEPEIPYGYKRVQGQLQKGDGYWDGKRWLKVKKEYPHSEGRPGFLLAIRKCEVEQTELPIESTARPDLDLGDSPCQTPGCIKIGRRLKFAGMKRPFPVVAHNKHFTICAYRLTGCLAHKEFIYTIIDWDNNRRGPDSMIFGPALNYLDPKQAAKALAQLGDGKMHRKICKKRGEHYGKYVWCEPELEVSRRRSCPLDLEAVLP